MIEDCIKLLWYGSEHPLIRQLFERFFTYIAYHFPHVFGAPFNRKYESIPKT
jgi:deoxyribodipyrimidine photo-lyase